MAGDRLECDEATKTDGKESRRRGLCGLRLEDDSPEDGGDDSVAVDGSPRCLCDSDDIYMDLILEVMSTLQVPKTIDLMSTKCISFSVGTTVFKFGADDLSRLLEIDAMQGLNEEELDNRVLDVPKYAAILLIQYALSRSICGRLNSSGVAQNLDMLCLYGIVKKKNIHLGWVFAYLFQKQNNTKVKAIFLRPYGDMLAILEPEKRAGKRARRAAVIQEEEEDLEEEMSRA
nr:hypothetical protein Itr_chr08CG16680 [Ipomoea trifida]